MWRSFKETQSDVRELKKKWYRESGREAEHFSRKELCQSKGIWRSLVNGAAMHVFLRSTSRAGIPRFPASWSQLWGGGSCLLFLSLTADVGAPNNVIQFPVFHFSGKPLSQCVWCGVCVCVRMRQKSWWAEGEEEEEEIYRPDTLGAGYRVRGNSTM